MLVDTSRTIWLLVLTLNGTFVNVTQLAPVSEAADWSRYGLFVNGQVKTNELGGEKPRFNGGYVSTTEMLSKRIALVALIPLVALMP